MITPHELHTDLGKALGFNSLYFKREDLHPYGSHKGRSIPSMIDLYEKQGKRHFGISSSGNSALAAALYVKEINSKRDDNDKIKLEIFFGKNANKHKLSRVENLKDEYISTSVHDRPLQTLFTKSEAGIQSLRQSTDDTALLGYTSLAEELLLIPNLSTVFIGTSSGTTAQALADYFRIHAEKVSINIIQTQSCHPIAEAFVDDEGDEDIPSIADAIVDQRAVRKETLVRLLSKTGGSGFIAHNEQIEIAQELTKKHTGIHISPNSALSVAGLMEASYTGKVYEGSVVCIICGE